MFTLHAKRSDGGVTISVRDGGQWRAARGRGRGRGLTIIKAAMDEMEVKTTSSGTEIIMRRRLQG
jgi:anti-sigma regulatory factor (Ser/Thr protein kinase)